MKKNCLSFYFFAGITLAVVLFSGCRKINDYTQVGGDLIPQIDNIHTFDTTLNVYAFNDTFSLQYDSLRMIPDDKFFLGVIHNDPFFGKTNAQIFLELKPEFLAKYPFARRDSTLLDSVVLVLSYVSRYGDSTIPQTINVYELTKAFKSDSAYLLRVLPFTHNTTPLNLPGQLTDLTKLDDSVKVFKDTTAAQLRIKLDTNFARRIMNYDTINFYKNDSAFKSHFKGFAIKSEGAGNALICITPKSANTKLAFYYRIPKKGGGDSLVVTYFTFNANCNAANYVKRDYSGTPVAAAAGLNVQAPIVYIQKTPGSFATIKIPDLTALTNRVVHRAELIMEQLYDPSDDKFTPPSHMFLDAYDPSIPEFYKFRTIPYSLDLVIPGGFNFDLFGTSYTNGRDPNGKPIKVWRFNLSRYVQNIVNGKQSPYDLRLFAPYIIRGKTRMSDRAGDYDIQPGVTINPTIADGRIRLGGGNHPTQRMRLRIVYSKI